MDILTFDFETFYAKDYSLSKITTEEYIRDPRFEVVGVSAKLNDEPAEWFSGTKAQTKRWMQEWDWGNSVAVAHNAMFDAAILNWHFDLRPKLIADTLSMLRAIDGPDAGNSLAKAAERYGLGVKGDEVINALGKRRVDFSPYELDRYGKYCINDTEMTYKLFGMLAPLIPKMEMRLIDLTMRMFTEPQLLLDKDVLEKHLTDVRERKEALLAKIDTDKSTLMSNPKLAQLLSDLGVYPPKKVSPTTNKLTWAFGKNDEAFKALLDHYDPMVQAVVAARMGVKSTLEETRTERFIGIAERGTLPVPLRYYAAHTGRFGGDDKVNLQNLPRKSALKEAIKAPPGYVLVDCDSSQIEARVLAWLAGQEDLVEFFRRNNDEIAAGIPKAKMQFDPYKIMASYIYGVQVNGVTDTQRFVGKTTILGAGYGMGHLRFQAQLKSFNVDLSERECRNIIRIYRETYPKITELWDEGNKVLKSLRDVTTCQFGREGVLLVDLLGIRLPNGMYIRYPGLRMETGSRGEEEYFYDTKRGRATVATKIYGGKVVENVSQALARIIVAQQMLMISRRYKVAMTVHDSVVALVPEGERDEAVAFIEACMRTRPKWAEGLPLNCESKVGVSYGG
jgi:DNA polymerase I-like protein with 3'-5' exonuclease and polymerase domains